MSDETTLRDTIEAAVDAVGPGENTLEATPTPLETESAGEAEARAERARDAAGRFTKAEQDAAAKALESQAAPEPEAQPRPPRPSSWKKDYQERWDKLVDTDPDMANYLLEREQQYAKGVSTYKTEADRAREFQQILEPHAPRWQGYGMEPTAYIDRLLRFDALMATGTQAEKQRMIAAIARSVGITDLYGEAQEAPGGYVPPELLNTVQSLEQKLQMIERQRERDEQTRYASEVEAFAEGHPYLDDLSESMAQLLETGLAADMEEAYAKALRLNDELWEKAQAEDPARKSREKQALAQKARLAAVSPRSSTPTGTASASTSQQGGDLRSTLSAAFDAAVGSGGRI